MVRVILACMLLMASGLLSAQQLLKIDTSELVFNSSFEREVFTNYTNQQPDHFALFLAIDSTVTNDQYKRWKNTFDSTIASLSADFATKKKNDKRARFLYESVHKSFLSKYEEISYFNQIFRNGVYNCVTGTALYSLVFDHFSIPYAIQERPTHVYLVAYPAQERIQIETTTPIGGYRVYDQAFKQQFVKKLTDFKLISTTEFQTQTVDQLFDKHFFSNEVITLTQLAGIQYYNSALTCIDQGKKEKALEQLEKYYFLYPDEKSRFLMFSLAGEIFNSLTYSDSKKINYLIKLCKFKREGITHDHITGEFYRITQLVFNQNGDREQYEKIYNTLFPVVEDAETKEQLTYIFNYEVGRIAYNQERYSEAAGYLEKALVAKPKSIDMTNLFIANLAMMRKNSRDKNAFITQMQAYGEQYPALRKNNYFFKLLSSTMLESFGTSYENGNITEGEKYRLMFEALATQNPDASLVDIEFELGRAYSAACVYYFKRNQRSKARTFIEKGLTYAPDNYELLSRKEMLN